MNNVRYLFANGAVTYAPPDKRQRHRRIRKWIGIATLAILVMVTVAVFAR